jgi:RNA polymerase sigma factor for flagellar operon FliA
VTRTDEGPPLTAAQRQLVLDAQGWLRRACRREAKGYRGLLRGEEVLQTMQLAAAEAARTFDPERGASFRSFAWLRVMGAVVVAAGREVEARRPLRRILAASVALERGAVEFHDQDDAIAKKAEELTARIAASWAIAGTRDDEEGQEAEGRQRVVDDAIAGLPERSRLIVERYYLEGRTLREVADELGISYATVRRHNEEALAAIREACGTAGY